MTTFYTTIATTAWVYSRKRSIVANISDNAIKILRHIEKWDIGCRMERSLSTFIRKDILRKITHGSQTKISMTPHYFDGNKNGAARHGKTTAPNGLADTWNM